MWEPMSIDEYAAFEIANGAPVIRAGKVWWRCVRPFFYQPLFPFLEMTPFSTALPFQVLFGGFQHNVPSRAMANSERHFFLFDNTIPYSPDLLRHQHRSAIKKGLAAFTVRLVPDAEEFAEGAYPVYRSFYERTGYAYKKDRLDRKGFARWAGVLYSFPKVRIFGAYRGSELCSVETTYLVEDVLFEGSSFSKTEHLRHAVTDVMIHTVRKLASEHPGIRSIYRGGVSGQANLDHSKLRRGFRVVSQPAFYLLNPLAYIMIRFFLRSYYKKLRGSFDIYQQPVPALLGKPGRKEKKA